MGYNAFTVVGHLAENKTHRRRKKMVVVVSVVVVVVVVVVVEFILSK